LKKKINLKNNNIMRHFIHRFFLLLLLQKCCFHAIFPLIYSFIIIIIKSITKHSIYQCVIILRKMLPGNFGIDFVFPKKQYSLWNIEDHFFQLKYFILSFNYIVKKEIKKIFLLKVTGI